MIPEILEYHSNFWGASTATLNPEESIRHRALFFSTRDEMERFKNACAILPSFLRGIYSRPMMAKSSPVNNIITPILGLHI